jgi:hypothetical protein
VLLLFFQANEDPPVDEVHVVMCCDMMLEPEKERRELERNDMWYH